MNHVFALKTAWQMKVCDLYHNMITPAIRLGSCLSIWENSFRSATHLLTVKPVLRPLSLLISNYIYAHLMIWVYNNEVRIWQQIDVESFEYFSDANSLQSDFLKVGMPLLTRCHWQCLGRLSQIFATLCKVCFYGWFSIEDEVNAGNFCPGLIHWALLSVQFGCFSKKIEYFGK